MPPTSPFWDLDNVLVTPHTGDPEDWERRAVEVFCTNMERYVALHESYIHHHVAYGRPFPPRYKDLLAERLTTAGELGIEGRRLAGLDVVIVPMAGARYEVHGIRPQVVPLMVDTDAALTAEAVHDAIRYHAGLVTAVCAVGYETTGCGRGRKSDGATSDLMIELGRLARRHNIPFIVDKARGIPGLGSHPDAFAADVMLFSMDKAAGALTSGLAIGPEDRLLPLRRAMGMHGDRAGNAAYGKGVFAAFDPGREALASLVAALTWLRDNHDLVVENTRRLHALAVEAFASLSRRFPGAILIESTADSGGVEVNYTRTWSAGGPGIPIFPGEDGAAGTHLITAGLASLGLGPCGGDEGNLFVTPERGLVDDDGGLIEDRARIALMALARVIEVLADMFGA